MYSHVCFSLNRPLVVRTVSFGLVVMYLFLDTKEKKLKRAIKRMKPKARYLVIISLWIALGFWMKTSVNRLGMERTTFAASSDPDSFKWPVFTVCPFFGQTTEVYSFEDVMEHLQTSVTYFEYVFFLACIHHHKF